MTIITLTVAHWYTQKMRRYPQWDNYAHDYINAYDYACTYACTYTYAYAHAHSSAYANADAYAYAHDYDRVGRYNLTCANGGTQR
jgi:hypothetical protein